MQILQQRSAGSDSEQRRIVSHDLADGSRTKRVMEAFTGAGLMAFSLANVLLPEVTARISGHYNARFDPAISLRGGIGRGPRTRLRQ